MLDHKDRTRLPIFRRVSTIGGGGTMAPPLMSYECSEYVYPHLNIHNSSTRSHALEDENRARTKVASVTGLKRV